MSAEHLPFPLRTLTAGVHRLDAGELFEPAEAGELVAKIADLDAHLEASVASLPGSRAAEAELAELVGADEPTIASAARRVVDDLVLLDPDDLSVVAGAVVHPNRWSIHEKLGRPVSEVHAPVPGFAGRLAAQTDRLLHGLQPGRGLWRCNWGVLDDPTLHQPRPGAGMPVSFDPEALWLRIERQALWRLPRTRSILFAIRTRQWRLSMLATAPEQCAGLADAVRTTPDDLAAYKGVVAIREDLLGWLDQAGRMA
jgi:hypothetical protein